MKKLSTLVLCFLICLFATVSPNALVATNMPADNFITFVTNMYNDRNMAIAMDNQGNDVTKQFFNQTESMYINNDWESLHKYFLDNNLQLEYIHSNISRMQRSGDLAKTQEKYCYALVRGVSGAPNPSSYTQEVTFLLRGTVFYNPNTMQITSVTKMILDTYVSNGGSVSNTNATSSNSGTKATISGTVNTTRTIFVGTIPNYTVQFQPATGSLTISL